ncbi:hypothetical protein GAR05_02174 [Micromonospora saelicesensis]|uniref:Major facilitator superfamily (MFS) profile domain-containing protein n=1 Tax=Micromonospora saelicesensis TaxID=285676 RepID=A0ABX9CKL7_9ACTN|nr:DUF6223 family protein [Micromonospora saelicesensis]RAO00204.1 hypothetical protein GAR05_02174 [Micromonospora saelicesensis]RAO62622.1 hypothetical protein PSN01_00927 [Micromonospora saelicesensis]
MSVRHLLATAVAAPLGGIELAAPAAAHIAAQPTAATALSMSSGRLGASAAVLLGLVGTVIGGLALARPTSRLGTGSGSLGAVLALAMGLIGMALGGLVVATSDSGIGTGNGRGGAYVALAVGLAGVVLGGLALLRARRTGRLAG